MDGMTRAELDEAESYALAARKVPMRPRDAATVLVLDREGGDVRVLMGRRHARHAFMPGKFVFPGGRTDPADSRIRPSQPMHPAELDKLIGGSRRVSPARARSIALSAIRETYEETGLLIGRHGRFDTHLETWSGFAEQGVEPAPDRLRFIARAITPPGRVRRFDTRFFAAWRSDVARELPEGGPTGELEELVWLPLPEAAAADVPAITRTIISELGERLRQDPDLTPGGPIPHFRLVGAIFTRTLV